MFNFSELEQFVAFSDNKTLTKVSEVLNISQPTLTRSMRHIETEFGVPLFKREKNKLTLNDTGELAVEYARRLLALQNNAIQSVQAFDKKQHSITIESCAPKPLWSLAAQTAQNQPDNEISSRLCTNDEIIADVQKGEADIGILPYEYSGDGLVCRPYIEEQLYICAPPEHEIHSRDSVTFSELNGYNCLLRDKIGFWADMCYKNMPASKFLVQTKEDEFIELVHSSSLLCFTTNLVRDYDDILAGRKIIPIVDSCADVMYYIIERH